LLDTGVDAAHPYLRGRILPGVDIIEPGGDASAGRDPQDPTRVERHGTELAGIVAGAGGPGGLHGAAPGATVLPIRIAGWQPDAAGRDVVYGRSDQLIAGLDRAVDPNGDGDAHDAVRVALIGVTEPYAAFAQGPEALAVQGALDLNTLVVTPAGNDGVAGPSFGSVSGPAGAPGALAVGATDSLEVQPRVGSVLARDHDDASAVPVHGVDGGAGTGKDGGRLDGETGIERAEPLAHLGDPVLGEPPLQLLVERWAQSAHRVGAVDRDAGFGRERVPDGSDARSGVDQGHVEVEPDHKGRHPSRVCGRAVVS